MKISIFGLGYVGAVSAGCLASDGHTVIGVDPNQTKVELINRGQSPIVEKDIDELIAAQVEAGRLSATVSVAEAVNGSELSLVCVGTPQQLNGNLDLSLRAPRVRGDRRRAQATRPDSTSSSRAARCCRARCATSSSRRSRQRSGKTAGVDFGVCNNPEFLREGTAV